MAWTEGLFRVVAFTTGVGVLAATTHNLIVDGPGYGSPRATIYITIAAAIAVAAIGVGYAVARGWTLMALGLICGIVAFEAAGLVITAERVIADREALQAPVRFIEERRANLIARIAQLTDELKGLEASDRLTAALARQEHVAADVTDKAALPGCARNCRQLLEAQTADAETEVAAARAALAANQDAVKAQLGAARDELAATPPPASKTGLAKRLGWEPWVIDLLLAGLMSLAGNLTACILIAIGANRTLPQETVEALPTGAPSAVAEATSVAPRQVLTAPANDVAEIGCVDRYATQHLEPDETGQVRVRAALDDYARWCAERGFEPATPTEAIAALANLTRRDGLEVEFINGGDAIIHGLRIRAGGR